MHKKYVYQINLLHRRALDILALREHSRFELTQKLKKHCDDNNIIQQVLNELETRGHLSEQRFIEAYILSRKNKGYGPNRIRQELNLRRVNKMAIENVLTIEQNWEQLANLVCKKKFGVNPIINSEEKIKRQRFLLQRGFWMEDILMVLRKSSL